MLGTAALTACTGVQLELRDGRGIAGEVVDTDGDSVVVDVTNGECDIVLCPPTARTAADGTAPADDAPGVPSEIESADASRMGVTRNGVLVTVPKASIADVDYEAEPYFWGGVASAVLGPACIGLGILVLDNANEAAAEGREQEEDEAGAGTGLALLILGGAMSAAAPVLLIGAGVGWAAAPDIEVALVPYQPNLDSHGLALTVSW